jgi:hypothetical protein
LPFVLRAGDSTEAQGARVRKALTRRIEHIARLQERERAFSQEIITQVRKLFSGPTPLGQSDIEVVEGLFRREDALLKLLYDREKEFSRDIEWLQRRVADRKLGLPIIGKAKLATAPEGYYPHDEWCAPLLTFDLKLSAPSTAMVFHGRVSHHFPQGQTLEGTIRDRSEKAHFGTGEFNWKVPAAMAADERVSVRIRASESICPATADSSSKDMRDLAYQLHSVEVV